MRKLFALVFVSILLAPLGALAGEGDRLWLDVRSQAEYEAGHMDGAINIPHTEVAERIEAVESDKSRPIVVYCRSGRRAGMALEALKDMGYQDVTNARNQEGAEALKEAAEPSSVQ